MDFTGVSIQDIEKAGKIQTLKQHITTKEVMFFVNLKPTKLAIQLKEYLRDNPRAMINILTSIGKTNSGIVHQQKITWLVQFFGDDASRINFNYVLSSKDKAKFATADTLLIDDRKKALVPFAKAGGKVLKFNAKSDFQTNRIMNSII
ncbi:hypothetical protein VmeM32_00025 [Vibrio phage vB_VmeM-32]|nr:hypothetical protein VmeM32_00025 [Vibrio phage vB_VmeM-32]